MIYTKELRRQLKTAAENEMRIVFANDDETDPERIRAGLDAAGEWASTIVSIQSVPVGLDFREAETDRDGEDEDDYYVDPRIRAVVTAIEYFGFNTAQGDWHDQREERHA